MEGAPVRSFAISVLLIIGAVNQVFAIAPVNTMVIKEAQEYGIRQANLSSRQFLAPWTAYEEKAAKLAATADQAQLYTPFLLVALDAREKTLKSDSVNLENSEQVLIEYKGFFIFFVTLHDHPTAMKKMSASLVQETQMFSSYYLSEPVLENITFHDKPLTLTKFYVYFPDSQIVANKPVTLVVTDTANYDRRFYFDLEKVR